MKSIKVLVIVCALSIISSVGIFGQDMPMHNMKDMKHGNSAIIDSSIIHKGVVNLKVIDKNKDGKVFQDQMDWNVISDKPGKCPLCKMTLKEVTLEKAKVNLLKHNFRVKQ